LTHIDAESWAEADEIGRPGLAGQQILKGTNPVVSAVAIGNDGTNAGIRPLKLCPTWIAPPLLPVPVPASSVKVPPVISRVAPGTVPTEPMVVLCERVTV
jgi:hypothetical protein